MEQGQVDAAASAIARALDDPHFDRLGRSRLLPAAVEIAIAAGKPDRAVPAVEELEAIAADFDSVPLTAAARSARGALQLAQGDTAAAIASLQESWRLWRSADLPYEAARARAALGAALRRNGDEYAAVMELKAARAAFERLGARGDLAPIQKLLGGGDGEAAGSSRRGSRVVKTFMFTDIVNSTSLVEAMGDAAWEDLLEWHDQTLRQIFTKHCGEEVKQVGDGFLVAFDDPGEAIDCAAEIQHRLAGHRRLHGFAPQVRIGLHRASALRRGGDYAGRGVHVAARVGALAGGGEVLATTDVIARNPARFPVSPPRSLSLRGVTGTVEVVSVLV